ncbi:MAG: response regulator [Lysobacterales bacterium]
MNSATANSSAPLKNILIIDDDPDSLLLVRTMIDYVGHRSVTAHDFKSALAALEDGPAAVVLDLIMPERTSERIILEIVRSAPGMPVVLISATSNDVLAQRAAECIAQGINVVSTLRKPFWVDAMVSALEQAIPPSSEQVLAPD